MNKLKKQEYAEWRDYMLSEGNYDYSDEYLLNLWIQTQRRAFFTRAQKWLVGIAGGLASLGVAAQGAAAMIEALK